MEQVGSIATVFGRVTAVSEDGDTRTLSDNGAVYAGDVLIAALASGASVYLANGNRIEVNAGTVVVIDDDVYAPQDDVDDGSAGLSDVQFALRAADGAARRGAVA